MLIPEMLSLLKSGQNEAQIFVILYYKIPFLVNHIIANIHTGVF